MFSTSGKCFSIILSVCSRTHFFFSWSFWWLYSSTSSMCRKTSPCSRASTAAGKRSSRSSMSIIFWPSEAQTPRDVGLSDIAVRLLKQEWAGYWCPNFPHPHG